MSSREYIESGILELYVMGSLGTIEMQQVRDMAVRYPEIAEEIRNIELILENYAKVNAIQPDPGLKDRVMGRIKQENKPGVKTVQLDRDSGRFYRMLAAASFALLVLSSAFNYYIWIKFKETRQELGSLNREKLIYANQVQLAKYAYDQALAEISVIQNKDYRPVELKGLAIAPNSFARVYWNAQSKETFIDIGSLPAPPSGKQYQLWALYDGKPVDAGVFNSGKTLHLQRVKNVENAQAFAVTLEPEGGSPAPTMSAMYVMGNV